MCLGTTGRSEAPFGAKGQSSRKWSEEPFAAAKQMSKFVGVPRLAQNTKAGKVWLKGSRRHLKTGLIWGAGTPAACDSVQLKSVMGSEAEPIRGPS